MNKFLVVELFDVSVIMFMDSVRIMVSFGGLICMVINVIGLIRKIVRMLDVVFLNIEV